MSCQKNTLPPYFTRILTLEWTRLWPTIIMPPPLGRTRAASGTLQPAKHRPAPLAPHRCCVYQKRPGLNRKGHTAPASWRALIHALSISACTASTSRPPLPPPRPAPPVSIPAGAHRLDDTSIATSYTNGHRWKNIFLLLLHSHTTPIKTSTAAKQEHQHSQQGKQHGHQRHHRHRQQTGAASLIHHAKQGATFYKRSLLLTLCFYPLALALA